jgi:hypothetical protein
MLFFYLNMRILKFLPIFFLLIFTACETVGPPPIISFYAGEGQISIFLSPTNWKEKNSKAKLDVTYRTGVDWPAIVNISFYGNKSTPNNVSSAFLHGTDIECPLEYTSVILVNPDKNELRISFNADRDKFIKILETEQITLSAEVDGVAYVYVPEKRFFDNKNKLLDEISTNYLFE